MVIQRNVFLVINWYPKDDFVSKYAVLFTVADVEFKNIIA